jgi:hypothetical protein
LGTCWASPSAAIQHTRGIESDRVADYYFRKTWPADREQGARVIGGWLKTEAQFYVKHQARSFDFVLAVVAPVLSVVLRGMLLVALRSHN